MNDNSRIDEKLIHILNDTITRCELHKTTNLSPDPELIDSIKTKDKIIYALAITAILTLSGGLIYSGQVHELKAELKKVHQKQSPDTQYLSPVKFSPYTIIKPEDSCLSYIIEINGYRSCMSI